MSTGHRPLVSRKEAVIWTAAAVLALSGVVVGGVLRAAPSAAAGSEAGERQAAWAQPVASAPRSEPDPSLMAEDDRPAAFLVRRRASTSIESVLARAFGPAPVPTIRVAARPRGERAVRVTRGATPQACLAQAVYYEARGEPLQGQAAVAQVVLNRAHSGLHPSDVCGVVFEGAARAGCQFSFACDGRLGRRRPEAAGWRRAEVVAAEAMSGPGRPELAGALNYHADYVRPRWAAQLARTAEIGRHIFYSAARPAAHALGWSFVEPATAPSGA